MKRLVMLLLSLALAGCATLKPGPTETEYIIKNLEKEGCDYAALFIENHHRYDASIHTITRWHPRASNKKLVVSQLTAYSGRRLVCVEPDDAQNGWLLFRVNFIGLGRDVFVMDRVTMLREGEILRVIIPEYINFGFFANAPLQFLPIFLDIK